MRKLFKNKYELGYNAGWSEGFLIGSKKAIKEHKKVIIATIEKDLKENGKHYNPGIIAGVHSAISMIRKIK
jgi:hypothetical protein